MDELFRDAGRNHQLEHALHAERTIRASSVDHDNLPVTVFGKGRKERGIPFSFELRNAKTRDRHRAASSRLPLSSASAFLHARAVRLSE